MKSVFKKRIKNYDVSSSGDFDPSALALPSTPVSQGLSNLSPSPLPTPNLSPSALSQGLTLPSFTSTVIVGAPRPVPSTSTSSLASSLSQPEVSTVSITHDHSYADLTSTQREATSVKGNMNFSEFSKRSNILADKALKDVKTITDLKKIQSALSQQISTHFHPFITSSPVRIVDQHGAQQLGSAVGWNDPHATEEGKTLGVLTMTQLYFFDHSFIQLTQKENLCKKDLLEFQETHLAFDDWNVLGPHFLGQPFFESHLSSGITTSQRTLSALHLAQFVLFRHKQLLVTRLLIHKALLNSMGWPNHKLPNYRLFALAELFSLKLREAIENFSPGIHFPNDFWKECIDYSTYLRIEHCFKSHVASSLESAKALIDNAKDFIFKELITEFSDFTRLEQNELKWKDPYGDNEADRVGNHVLLTISQFYEDFCPLIQEKNLTNIISFRERHLKNRNLFCAKLLGNEFFQPIFNNPSDMSSSPQKALSVLHLTRLIILQHKQCLVSYLWLIDNHTFQDTICTEPTRTLNLIQLLLTFMYESYVKRGIAKLSNQEPLPSNFWSTCRLYKTWLNSSRLNENNPNN